MGPALWVLLFFAPRAFAHGPVAGQASTAVTKATVLFLKEEEKTREAFQSVSCKVTGEERFQVDFFLKDGAKLSYACGLDDNAKPVKWGCQAIAPMAK